MNKELKIEGSSNHQCTDGIGRCPYHQAEGRRLSEYEGCYGAGTTAPQTYIQINANTLWQAWKFIIRITIALFLKWIKFYE